MTNDECMDFIQIACHATAAFLYHFGPEIATTVFTTIVVNPITTALCMTHHDTQTRLDQTTCSHQTNRTLQDDCYQGFENGMQKEPIDCRQIPPFQTLAPICNQFFPAGHNRSLSACIDGLLNGVNAQEGGDCAHAHAMRQHSEHGTHHAGMVFITLTLAFALASFVYGHFKRTPLSDYTEEGMNWQRLLCYLFPAVVLLTTLSILQRQLHGIDLSAATGSYLKPEETTCQFQLNFNQSQVQQCGKDFVEGATEMLAMLLQNSSSAFPFFPNDDDTYGDEYGAAFAMGFYQHANSMGHDQSTIPWLGLLAYASFLMVCVVAKWKADHTDSVTELVGSGQRYFSQTNRTLEQAEKYDQQRNTTKEQLIPSP